MDMSSVPDTSTGLATGPDRASQARAAAVKLEASFLSEMLKASGLGSQISQFSGGSGEDQFASFHREAIAERIARTGGFGLAEHFFRIMMEDDRDG